MQTVELSGRKALTAEPPERIQCFLQPVGHRNHHTLEGEEKPFVPTGLRKMELMVKIEKLSENFFKCFRMPTFSVSTHDIPNDNYFSAQCPLSSHHHQFLSFPSHELTLWPLFVSLAPPRRESARCC